MRDAAEKYHCDKVVIKSNYIITDRVFLIQLHAFDHECIDGNKQCTEQEKDISRFSDLEVGKVNSHYHEYAEQHHKGANPCFPCNFCL